MATTEKQIIANLKAGNYAPVYLLTGEENYAIDCVSDYFENNVIDEAFRDFDQTVLYAGETRMVDVIGAAKRYPMMSPVQLVLVKEAQNYSKKEEWELLADYLESPQPQTLLVFCYRHKSLDKRSRAYKQINSKGVVLDTKALRDYEVPNWILGYVTEKGYQITQDAASLLSQHLGTNLGKISNELSKVFIELQPGGTINKDIIERCIGISKDYNIFELQSAIGRKDIMLCNKIVQHFAANPKDNPLAPILAILYGYFVKLMIYHQLTDKSSASVASALKISPFFVKDYADASSRYPLPKLASCIGYLHDADLRSKGVRNSGNVTEGEILKELIFKIIH